MEARDNAQEESHQSHAEDRAREIRAAVTSQGRMREKTPGLRGGPEAMGQRLSHAGTWAGQGMVSQQVTRPVTNRHWAHTLSHRKLGTKKQILKVMSIYPDTPVLTHQQVAGVHPTGEA